MAQEIKDEDSTPPPINPDLKTAQELLTSFVIGVNESGQQNNKVAKTEGIKLSIPNQLPIKQDEQPDETSKNS